MVSADPLTIQQFSRTLQQLSIAPDICREATTAIRLLNRRKFDAVIVDLQSGEGAGRILDEVRLSPSNRTAVTFAIASDTNGSAALGKRASFVFERPLSTQSIRSTLKPAYGLILRERRRYFRCPISIPVVIRRQNKPELRCSGVNISEGGMALSTFVPLSSGEEVDVQFSLPGHKVAFLIESTICWWKTGHLGLRFVSLSQQHRSELQGWLSRKLEEMIPQFVAREFQKAEDSSRPSVPALRRGGTLAKSSTERAALAAVADEPGKPDTSVHTRRWQRCRLDIPIRIIIRNSDATKIYDGRGNEISEGGMAVTAGVELKPGEDVAIEFTPPYAGDPIRVRGTVRNRTGYRYGVEFVSESAEETEQLNRLRPMLHTPESH